jgi:glycosyltransferase involved in cell wall biosynthesis
MKIAIDATSLLLRSAGVRNYLQYWLLALRESARTHGAQVTTYPPGVPVPGAVDHERSVAGTWGTRLRLDLVGLLNLRGNPAIDAILAAVDVFHASQHTANRPRWKKTTATIFDLSCWTTPQSHTPENVAATRLYGERILQTADGLIAISAHARDDAVEILQIPPERIRVIYPGIAEAFFDVPPEEIARSRRACRLERPYLLFVGCIEPRKNVPSLVRAYRRLPEGLQRDIDLVLAGPFGWASEDVRTMLRDSGERVRYLGYVPEADLPGLIAGAVAMVYPSFYEGFGLPVAQAMATGIPVIGSDRSCLPEVIGDAGLLVDPDSVEDLSSAMERIVSTPTLAQELGNRGRVRAERFRWSRSADESLEFFRSVAGG